MKQNMALILLLAVASSVTFAQVESLPPPVVHGNSFEIISNSRYSSHSGFTGSLSDTVLSNVLWAMGRVPSFGSSYREIYVARLDEAVYVLHAFEKRSRKTRLMDIDLARARLADVMRQRMRRRKE